MIDISTNRSTRKYILKPTVPEGTEVISYDVTIGGVLIFSGQSRYFGGDYEVDCSDWIESYISNQTTNVTTVVVNLRFTFVGSTTQTMTYSYQYNPYVLDKNEPGTTAPYLNLTLLNCGFLYRGNTGISIPLMLSGTRLVGKTINKLEKTNYVDRYGDTHNGSMTNHYEIECFIDPCWLYTETGDDDDYEKVMLALQGSKKTTMVGSGVKISGMEDYNTIYMEGRIKDIEKVETSSSYSVGNKVPTYKIVFEVYR